MARSLAGAHFAGHLDGAAEPQQFFGQRRLTGVGVGNDRKGATAGNFSIENSHGKLQKAERPRLYLLPQCNTPNSSKRQYFAIQGAAGISHPGQGQRQ